MLGRLQEAHQGPDPQSATRGEGQAQHERARLLRITLCVRTGLEGLRRQDRRQQAR